MNRIFGNVELKFCSPDITRSIYKCPEYKSGWSFGYWRFYELKRSSQVKKFNGRKKNYKID